MENVLKSFTIDIAHLKNGKHPFSNDIDSAFFEAIPQELVKKGDAHVELEVIKTDAMVQVNMYIHGRVELLCDRSLRPFYYPIQSKSTLYFKFADRNEELSDDTQLIKSDTTYINMAQYVYEYIALEIPIKKIHPDLLTEAESSEGDILVYSSVNNENDGTDQNIDILDPRWEALKKLKNDP